MLKNLRNNQTVIYIGSLSVENCLCDGHHWTFPPSQFLNQKASTSVYLSFIRRPDKVVSPTTGLLAIFVSNCGPIPPNGT
jgi:hypothetical protein